MERRRRKLDLGEIRHQELRRRDVDPSLLLEIVEIVEPEGRESFLWTLARKPSD